MAIITKDEVLKIAALSRIAIHEHEIEAITQQLEAVLSYAQRVTQVGNVQEQVHQNINILRDDAVKTTPAASLLSRGPSVEENFYVVPAVLDTE